MKVHLRKRELTKRGSGKPRYRLYLDIYYSKFKRMREFIGIYLDPKEDKTYRQEKLGLAENIKAKRQLELIREIALSEWKKIGWVIFSESRNRTCFYANPMQIEK